MRVCLVYDCLYPYTIGGAERWYRNLAERLAASGHEVTFLTRRQWERDSEPTSPACASSPSHRGWSSIARRPAAHPSARCSSAWACSAHLLRRGRRYDVVHTASFPYFPLLAAGSWPAAKPVSAARRLARGLDARRTGASIWAASAAGSAGGSSARACAYPSGRSASRGCTSGVSREQGLLRRADAPRRAVRGRRRVRAPRAARRGRSVRGSAHPGEASARARACSGRGRRQLPDLRGEIYGDGPERPEVLRAIARVRARRVTWWRQVSSTQRCSRRRSQARSASSCRRAARATASSSIEAAARGVPVVVVAGPDNAAVELVEEGVNGVDRRVGRPAHELAAAIVRVDDGGAELRESAAAWFRRNAERLSFEHSLRTGAGGV